MEFLLLATAHFIALISPGPDFFLIMQTALRMKLRYVFCVCFGIALANGIYLAVAILGLEVISNISSLIKVLKYLGAGYLLYIGIMLLKNPMQSFEMEEQNTFLHKPSVSRQFTLGFMSGILNPKNIIFYFSIFTVMVSTTTPFSIRVLYGIWMTCIVLVWDCGIALLLGNSMVKQKLGNGIYYIEKLAGATLAGFGIMLIF